MKILYFILISILIIFCINKPALAKNNTQVHSLSALQTIPSLINGTPQLVNEINHIISESGNTEADITVYVKSMKSGEPLYIRNVNRSFTPASTLKVLTAEAALLFLGPEYRFSTQVHTDAKFIKNGILMGNIYIILSGDPTLTYYDLIELLISLKAQQIRGIRGNVYIDNTAYDQSYYGPGWDTKDEVYCYAAPISASIINHNCLSFQLVPSKIIGHAAQLITSPQYFYPGFKNMVVTKNSKTHACSIHLSSDQSSMINIDGCMTKEHAASGMSYVVTDIPEYTQALFKSVLTHIGVKVYGAVSFGGSPENLSLIGQHASQPLRLLINDMLKKSDNVIAGALFKKLGQLYTHRAGSWANGSQAVLEILMKQAGLRIAGLKILDGSGLSPYNLVTAAQLMQVLEFTFHHYPTSYEFISSLPIAGIDGTLKHRLTLITGKLRAKTGTISGVTSLAGYTVSMNKEPLAFVIMINGNKGSTWQYKAIEDKIAIALTNYKRY